MPMRNRVNESLDGKGRASVMLLCFVVVHERDALFLDY